MLGYALLRQTSHAQLVYIYFGLAIKSRSPFFYRPSGTNINGGYLEYMPYFSLLVLRSQVDLDFYAL